jgi:hypothetical protein
MDYYEQNQWRINGRTNINSQDVTQIETWSKLDFKNYLKKTYQELDLQEQEMKKVVLKKYSGLFSESKDIAFFPTLSDWYSLKKIEFLSSGNLFTKNELTENTIQINTIYDRLIAQNIGNPKLYFMNAKLVKNCDLNRCKNKLEQLQNLVKSDEEGDYKVFIMGDIMDELVDQKKTKKLLK